MTRHFYADENQVLPEQVAATISEQLAGPYGQTDALRTAVMYLPLSMPPAIWVKGALLAGINEGTARNRLREVRNYQRELGEI